MTDGGHKQRRRFTYPSVVDVEAIGPDGQTVTTRTRRPEESGPLTLWHLAAAVPAICRAIMEVTRFDIEQMGGSVAATMTDAIVVPTEPTAGLVACEGGPHQLPDGSAAVRLVSYGELDAALHRWDKVLCPEGGEAWKVECDSLDQPTTGIVLGVNKVLLGRPVGDTFHLVRSSDTGLGHHFLDPTGTVAPT
jgi:hypothetical protein